MRTKLLALLLFFFLGRSVYAQYSYNSCADFNGTSSQIAVPYGDELRPLTNMTIEVWVKTTNTAAGLHTIYGQNPANVQLPFLGLTGSDNKILFHCNGALTSTESIPTGAWTHIAAVYNGSQKKIYINGIEDASVFTSGIITGNTDSTFIGSSASGNYFKGQMDDLRIWNKAKNPSEIDRDMFVPLAMKKPSGIYTGLSAAWRFNTAGATVNDEAGAQNNLGYNRNLSVISYANKVADYYDYNGSLSVKPAGYLAVPHHSKLDATTAITIETWLKRDTATMQNAFGTIVLKRAGNNIAYGLFLEATGELIFTLNNGTKQISTPQLIKNSQWQHIEATYSASNGKMSIYLNGDLVASSTTTAEPIISSTDSLFIGCNAGVAAAYNGQLDEIRIWKNTVRSTDEIKNNIYKNINYLTMPAPQNLTLFSFDGSAEDTGTDPSTGSNPVVHFRSEVFIHSSHANMQQLSSPLLRTDEAAYLGSTYNVSTKRSYLPDDGTTSYSDSVYFASGGTVSDMKVLLLMNHRSANQVEIELTAPNGTTIMLTPEAVNYTDNMGSNGLNDLMTLFDQNADTTISYNLRGGLVPFSPRIRPYNSLNTFNGISRQGWWKMKFTDRYTGDQGFVQMWGLKTSSLTHYDPGTGTPLEYKLSQNYPNPFNPATKISYSIPAQGFVRLKVFDITGREVASLVNTVKEPGSYEVQFDGSQLSSGMYFYRLETENFIEAKKMLLIK